MGPPKVNARDDGPLWPGPLWRASFSTTGKFHVILQLSRGDGEVLASKFERNKSMGQCCCEIPTLCVPNVWWQCPSKLQHDAYWDRASNIPLPIKVAAQERKKTDEQCGTVFMHWQRLHHVGQSQRARHPTPECLDSKQQANFSVKKCVFHFWTALTSLKCKFKKYAQQKLCNM